MDRRACVRAPRASGSRRTRDGIGVLNLGLVLVLESWDLDFGLGIGEWSRGGAGLEADGVRAAWTVDAG